MKAIQVCLLFAGVLSQSDVTFSQWNMMYHFNDLDRQFSYVPKDILRFEQRIVDIVDVLNEIQADLSCIQEWNGNQLSPYLIDNPKTLYAALKASLAKATQAPFASDAELQKFKVLVDKKIPAAETGDFKGANELVDKKTKAPWAGISDATKELLEDWSDRLTALVELKRLYLYTAPAKWGTKVIQKATGQVLPEDESKGPGAIFLEKPAADAKETRQSLLVVWNKDKFNEVKADEFKVFTDEPDVAGTPNSQNFVVKELTVKGTSIQVHLICTHFKSKFDGFYPRRKLGRTIANYVAKQRKAGSKANFVLMGDFNTEISELAYDLNGNVLRFNPQVTLPVTQFNAQTIFVPRSQSQSVDARIDFEKKKKAKFDAFLTKIDPGQQATAQTQYKPRLPELEKFKEEFKSLPNDLTRPLWIELTNFATQRKIRVGEVDFEDAEYKQFVQNLLSANPTLKARVDEALNAFNQKTAAAKAKDPLGRFDDVEVEAQNSKAVRFGEVMGFLNQLQANKGIGTKLKDLFRNSDNKYKAWKENPSKFNLADHPAEFFIKLLMDEMLTSSKIDFILLNLYNRVNFLEARSSRDYPADIAYGVPSKETPSDHFPTWVKTTFWETPFNQVDLIGAPQETFSTMKNEYETEVMIGKRKGIYLV